MNTQGKKEAIRERIGAMPEDAAFTATDFSDVADPDSTRRALKELTDHGKIARAARGVYYKPRYSEMLGQPVPPDVDEVAQAVARARGWAVAPSGDHALNKLGLDTQVPATYAFISTGPYAELQVGPYEVRFKHAANRNVVGMSPTTLLVVQALKALGKEGVTDDVVARVARRLSADEKSTLLEESGRATAWVRQAVRRIAEGKAE